MFEEMNVDFQVEKYNLDKVLVKGTVELIVPVMEEQTEEDRDKKTNNKDITERDNGPKKTVKYFLVKLQDGSELKAYQVVMATGPTQAQMANIPQWVSVIGESYPEGRLQHTVLLMHHLPLTQQKLLETHCQRQTDTSQAQSESDR